MNIRKLSNHLYRLIKRSIWRKNRKQVKFGKSLILSINGLFLLLLISCGEEEHHKDDTVFKVTSPVRKDTIISKDYVCQIHAISHIEIRAQERGFLQEIFVDEGQFVKKGQPLFQIMPTLYEAELQKVQAEAEYARIEYQNTKLLADSNVVSDNQLALVKAKYDQALAEVRLAEVHLGFTKIVAPFDGIIDRFHVRLGSLIEEGDLMTNLADNSTMWVYYNVSESEYLDYMTSVHDDSLLKVKLLMANNKYFNHEGVVSTIEADFNNETGNVAFRATFPNPEGLLRHGETGNIHMDIPLKDALLIPQKSTFEILEKKFVFVIDDNNIVRTREINVLAEMPHLYSVEGVSEDDIILLDGLRKVKENDKIMYEFQEPQEVLAHLELYAE